MILERPWSALEKRLKVLAEDATRWDPLRNPEDEELEQLGLATSRGLTEAGTEIYMAKHVLSDESAASEALGQVLREQQVVTAFCEPLWARGEVPVGGAVSLLKRLTGGDDDTSAKRWLEMMNAGGIVAYNRNRSTLRVLFNPSELVPPDEEAERERARGHVISPETPYGNLVALRDLVRSARSSIRWYEPHMPPKVLEVLHGQVEKGSVTEIRILSGPANVDGDLKDEFKRFASEMKRQRGIDCQWRVLSKKEAGNHHDRVFFGEGIARNIPPLNSILKGSTGEILESGIDPATFEEWWGLGQDIKDVQPPPPTA